ncbi:MAG: penicillin-binding protein 2, partial [Acidimicrobiales bacterium]
MRDPAAAATALSRLLMIERSVLLDRLTGKGRFVLLAHTVPEALAADVRDLALPGIGTFDEFKRYQPSGDVARSLLGGVSEDGNVGYSGLEEQFDRLLDGRAGQVTYERSGEGATIAGGQQRVKPARPGEDIVLTLDRAMQYEAEETLARHVAVAGAKGGIAIVTRPKTGEVLAMANVAVTPGGAVGEPAVVRPTSNNLALTTVYEPGSVNKVITLAGAIDSGIVEPDTTLDVPDHIRVADHTFKDSHDHPTTPWSVTDILASSSNVGTITIAQKLGEEGLDGYLRSFGFGTKSALGFPDESAGLMLDVPDWSGTSIGAIPIGQGISVTAMQMLAAYNVIANDGVYVAPRLVQATVGTDGRRRDRPPSRRRPVTSAETATKLRAMMAKVVSAGTGEKADVPGYSVAGKTGTARKPLAEHMPGNGYMDLEGRYHYVATFAGVVPAEDPELSIIVVLDEPTASIFAGDVAAPAFSELARDALRRYQIAPPAEVAASLRGLPEGSPSARAVAGPPLAPSPTS